MFGPIVVHVILWCLAEEVVPKILAQAELVRQQQASGKGASLLVLVLILLDIR